MIAVSQAEFAGFDLETQENSSQPKKKTVNAVISSPSYISTLKQKQEKKQAELRKKQDKRALRLEKEKSKLQKVSDTIQKLQSQLKS